MAQSFFWLSKIKITFILNNPSNRDLASSDRYYGRGTCLVAIFFKI
jgi:hypothetical protein